MKKLLHHYVIEKKEINGAFHIFISEIFEKPIKVDKAKRNDGLARIFKETMEKNGKASI